jgi:protein-S-isoprenylcysteine O-methyltransferase Ste14
MTDQTAGSGLERIRINLLRGTFAALVPLVLFSSPVWERTHWLFEAFEVLGISLVIAGVLGRFWSILYIGGRKNNMVMQDGPYSVCRHPLYLFSTVAVMGFGLMLGSLLLTAIFTVLTFVILSRTAANEEARLRDIFGAAYDSYAARVPRILPDPSLFRTDDTVTFSVAQLRINLMDALVFLSFIPLSEIAKELKETGLLPTFPIW